MDGELNPKFPWPRVPHDIAEHVVVDSWASKLYVDQQFKSSPTFLTYVARLQNLGLEFQIKSVPYEEIAERRSGVEKTKLPESAATTPATQTFGGTADYANITKALKLFELAVKYKTTDIHLFRMGTHALIQFRVNRGLLMSQTMSMNEAGDLERAIYSGIATSKSGSYMPLEFQDAEISGKIMGRVGLDSMRIIRGYAYPVDKEGSIMVMRLQYDDHNHNKPDDDLPPLALPPAPEGIVDFRSLGYTEAQVDKLIHLAEIESGVILFMGPVNSGKTTTMYNMLKYLAQRAPDLRQIVLERPVERPMPWAVQIPILGHFENDLAQGMAISAQLKNMLRMDFNIGGINEIRLGQVVHALRELIETGHKMITSVHGKCPHKFADRLLSLVRGELQREDFCDPDDYPGVISQRLVPILCPKCRTSITKAPDNRFSPRQLRALKTFPEWHSINVRGAGCYECRGTGVKGMTAVAEIVVTDEEYMDILRDEGSAAARAHYRARTYADPPIIQTAMTQVLAGNIDPIDMNKFVGHIRDKASILK